MQLLKGLDTLGSALSTKAPTPLRVEVSANNPYQENFFRFAGNMLVIPDGNNARLLNDGWLKNHIVFTIQFYKCMKAGMARPILYRIKDEKALKHYQRHSTHKKDLVDRLLMRLKAIEEIEDHELLSVLHQPNPRQSWSEFVSDLLLYWDLGGNGLIWGNRNSAGVIKELYNLPSHQMQGQKPSMTGFESFCFISGDDSRVFQGTDVLHLPRVKNPNHDEQGSHLWGLSRLRPVQRELIKSTQATEAAAEAMQNRGARVIIFPKGNEFVDGMTADGRAATDEIRKRLKQAGSGGIVGNSFELGHIQLGLSPVDLDILASENATKQNLCSAWGMKVQDIFPSESGTTYANAEQATQDTLRNGILPDLFLLREKLNSWLAPSYAQSTSEKLYIDFDLDCYTELQVDMNELYKRAGQIGLTLNERRWLSRYEDYAGPGGDVPLLDSSLTPITDLVSAGLDPVENDGSYSSL